MNWNLFDKHRDIVLQGLNNLLPGIYNEYQPYSELPMGAHEEMNLVHWSKNYKGAVGKPSSIRAGPFRIGLGKLSKFFRLTGCGP